MANELSILAPSVGSRSKRVRVGRGEGSGLGKTSGRGTKGAKSRSGARSRAYFEGGQNPLVRRLPKYGFDNSDFGRDFEVVNVEQLGGFEAGSVVTSDVLKRAGVVSRVGADGVKLLGRGEIGVALVVRLEATSGSARAKILAAGGVVE